MANESLPADVIEAIQNGETIEAIKRLRLSTGLGLKEAKDIVDAYSAGERVNFISAKPSDVLSDSLPPAVVEAIRNGNKIEAIKLVREHTGFGLKEAKDLVESSPHAMASNNNRRSSIEKPGGGNALLWFAGLVLVLVAVYYFLVDK